MSFPSGFGGLGVFRGFVLCLDAGCPRSPGIQADVQHLGSLLRGMVRNKDTYKSDYFNVPHVQCCLEFERLLILFARVQRLDDDTLQCIASPVLYWHFRGSYFSNVECY
jgi:hypothetical protein